MKKKYLEVWGVGVPAEGTFSKLNQPKERGKNQVIAPAFALFLRVILGGPESTKGLVHFDICELSDMQ